VVQIIKSSAIEAAHHVHYVVEDHRLVESTLLGGRPCRLNLRPLARLHLIAKQVVETLLARVHTAKDKYGLVHDDGGVAIARLGPHAFESANFEPEIRREAILVDIVHRVVAVPAPNNEHGVVADDGSVAESIKWLRTLSLDHLPLVFLLLEGAAPEVIVAIPSVVACENVKRAVVEHYSVVCAWTGLLSDSLDP